MNLAPRTKFHSGRTPKNGILRASLQSQLNSGDPDSSGIVAAAINVDETRVLASTSRLRLVVWDVTSGNCLRNNAMDRRIEAIEFGSTPSFAIVSSQQRGTYATRLSLTDGKVEFQFTKLKFPDSEFVTSISFDGKAKQFLLATSNGAVIARESETGTAGPGESSRDSEAVANASSVRGSTAALQAPTNPITVRQPSGTGIELIRFIRKMGYRLVTMSATAGWSIVRADYDEKHPLQVVQWDPTDSASKTDFFEDRVVDAVSDDRGYVAVASDDVVEIRQLDGQKEYLPLSAGGNVRSLCFDPASRYLVIGLENGDVLLWSFKEGVQDALKKLFSHFDDVNSIDFDFNGQRLISASDDRSATVWNVGRGALQQELHHSAPVVAAKFAADDIGIITLSRDGVLSIYNPSGMLAERLHTTENPVSMALDLSRSRAIVLDSANIVQVWNLRRRSVEGTIHLSELAAVGFIGASGDICDARPLGSFCYLVV